MTNSVHPMQQVTEPRLLAAALELQHLTGTAANVVPIPGTDRMIAIGTPADVRGLLADAPTTASAIDDVAHDVWLERVACARIADSFANEEGPGERRYSGNVISARILARTTGRVRAPSPSREAAGPIKTWQERSEAAMGTATWYPAGHYKDEEIADLRAALAQQSAAPGKVAPLSNDTIDTLARKHGLDGSMIVGRRHDYWRAFAADLLRAAQAQAGGSDTRDGAHLTIAFRLFDQELPALVDHSSSYGGTWNSDWCVVVDHNGHVSIDRFKASENEKISIENGDRKFARWTPPGSQENYRAWAYKSEVKAAMVAAMSASGQEGGHHD